jgi:hypothetical protein
MKSTAHLLVALHLLTMRLSYLTFTKQAILVQQVPLDHKAYKEFKAIQVLLAQLVLLDLLEPLDRRE